MAFQEGNIKHLLTQIVSPMHLKCVLHFTVSPCIFHLVLLYPTNGMSVESVVAGIEGWGHWPAFLAGALFV
jgi:hypothetical protein